MLAYYCKNCKSIIFSRSNRDYRSCECGNLAVDRKNTRILCKDNNYSQIELDNEVLLNQLLEYDFHYNKNMTGKFVIKDNNIEFIKKLVKVGEIFED